MHAFFCYFYLVKLAVNTAGGNGFTQQPTNIILIAKYSNRGLLCIQSLWQYTGSREIEGSLQKWGINVFRLVWSAAFYVWVQAHVLFGSWYTCLIGSSSLSPFTHVISFCIIFLFCFFTPTLSPTTSHPFTPPWSLHRNPLAVASYCSPCVTSLLPTLWPWWSSKLATCPRLKTMDLQVHAPLNGPFMMQSMGSLLTQTHRCSPAGMHW